MGRVLCAQIRRSSVEFLPERGNDDEVGGEVTLCHTSRNCLCARCVVVDAGI